MVLSFASGLARDLGWGPCCGFLVWRASGVAWFFAVASVVVWLLRRGPCLCVSCSDY